MGNGNSNDKPANISKITTIVKNSIDAQISNYNKNITNTINTTVNSSTNSMINENAVSVSASNTASNNLKMVGIRLGGNNNKLNVNQTITAKSQMTAAVSITQDVSELKEISANIQTQLLNNIKNDNELKTNIASSGALTNLQKNEKGIGDIVNSVLDSATALFGKPNSPAPTNDEITSIAETSIKTSISNTNINETSTTTAITNHFDTNNKNLNNFDCKLNTNATNAMEIADLMAGGSGNDFTMTQTADVTGLCSCMSTNLNIQTMVTALANANLNSTTNTSSSKNTSGNEAVTKVDAGNSKTVSDNTLKDAGAAAKGLVEGVGKGVGTAAEGIGKGVGTAAESTGKGVGTAAEGVGKGAADTIKAAGDAVAANNPFMAFAKYFGIVLGLCILGIGYSFMKPKTEYSDPNKHSDKNKDHNQNKEQYEEEQYEEEQYEEDDHYEDDEQYSEYSQRGGNINNSIFKIIYSINLTILFILFIFLLIFKSKLRFMDIILGSNINGFIWDY